MEYAARLDRPANGENNQIEGFAIPISDPRKNI
jgi:hypothetical protein